MPTIVSVTVDPGGTGDFTSMNAACAAMIADLVTEDTIWRIIGISSNGAADETPVNMPTVVTDAEHYIEIIAGEGHESTGIWDESKYRISTTGSPTFNIVSNHVSLCGLQIENITAGGYKYVVYPRGANFVLDRCHVRRRNATDTGSTILKIAIENIQNENAAIRARNCIFEGDSPDTVSAVDFYGGGNPYVFFDNCTVINTASGFSDNYSSSNGVHVRNCLAYNCSDPFHYISAEDGSNNADDIGTAVSIGFPGAVHTASGFVAGSYRPVSDSDIAQAGLNLSSEFTVDISGQSRPADGGWTIGAFQAESSSSSQLDCDVSAHLNGLSVESESVLAGTIDSDVSIPLDSLAASSDSSTVGNVLTDLQLEFGVLSVEAICFDEALSADCSVELNGISAESDIVSNGHIDSYSEIKFDDHHLNINATSFGCIETDSSVVFGDTSVRIFSVDERIDVDCNINLGGLSAVAGIDAHGVIGSECSIELEGTQALITQEIKQRGGYSPLSSLSLLELLPSSLAEDSKIRAIALAVGEQLKAVTESIPAIEIYSRIGELEEPLLSLLAWQFHVDHWDANWSVETKREAVRNSIKLHKKKGTPWAVRKAVEIATGEPAEVQEWFEYDGDPYKFKVGTETTVNEAVYQSIIEAVISAKNVRSHLDSVVFKSTLENPSFTGGVVRTGVFQHIPVHFDISTDPARHYCGAGIREADIIHINITDSDIAVEPVGLYFGGAAQVTDKITIGGADA